MSDFDQIDALIAKAEGNEERAIGEIEWRKEQADYLHKFLTEVSDLLKEKLKVIKGEVELKNPASIEYNRPIEQTIIVRIPSVVITGIQTRNASNFSNSVKVEAIRESGNYRVVVHRNMTVIIDNFSKEVSKDKLKETVVSALILAFEDIMNKNDTPPSS